mmetsp:Transcript_24012/g.66781  ORF Transcript_24012/g.66781 Transcript_24012/m.66781 type:complete len:179 (-) Transcript_24012:295-831(-)
MFKHVDWHWFVRVGCGCPVAMAESNQDIVVEADVRLPTPQSCVNQTSSERRTSDLVTASRFAFAAAANDEAEKWAQRAEHDDTFANDAAIAAALAELESLSYPAKPNATSSGQAQDDCIACLATTANARFIPCGHVVVCTQCALRVIPRKCPLCRYPFEQTALVFHRRLDPTSPPSIV